MAAPIAAPTAVMAIALFRVERETGGSLAPIAVAVRHMPEAHDIAAAFNCGSCADTAPPAARAVSCALSACLAACESAFVAVLLI